MLAIAALALVAALTWRWTRQTGGSAQVAPSVAPLVPRRTAQNGENLSSEEREALDDVLKRKGRAQP